MQLLILCPGNDVDVRCLTFAESSEILYFGFRLQTRKTDQIVAISHETRSRPQF